MRQWFIYELLQTYKVPAHLMMSETGFMFGKKRYRADILVYDREGKPLLVVECKAPEVGLSEETALQAMRYNAVLDVRFIILTNGNSTLAFGRDGEVFRPLSAIPSYEMMLCRP